MESVSGLGVLRTRKSSGLLIRGETDCDNLGAKGSKSGQGAQRRWGLRLRKQYKKADGQESSRH